MNGKQHSVCGDGGAIGTALTVYALTNDVATAGLSGLLVYPMAALPDIDHNATKLGRTRKKVVTAAVIATCVATAVAAVAAYFGKVDKKFPLAMFAVIAIIFLLTKTGFWKSLFKHRGITHSLFFAAIWPAAGYALGGAFFWCGVGIATGCLVHYIGDSVTTEGWHPFLIAKNFTIRFRKISSTSKALDGVAAFMCILWVVVGVALFIFLRR